MRIVNPEKPSRLSTPIAALPSRSTVSACLAVRRRLVDSRTTGLDTCPDTTTPTWVRQPFDDLGGLPSRDGVLHRSHCSRRLDQPVIRPGGSGHRLHAR